MSTSASILTKGWLLRALFNRVPEGQRRTIVVATMIAYVTNTNNPEKDFVRNMDRALKLSYNGNPAALELPIRISKVFWNNRELFHKEIAVLTNRHSSANELQQAATKITAALPEWLVKNTATNLVEDLVRYFTDVQRPLRVV